MPKTTANLHQATDKQILREMRRRDLGHAAPTDTKALWRECERIEKALRDPDPIRTIETQKSLERIRTILEAHADRCDITVNLTNNLLSYFLDKA